MAKSLTARRVASFVRLYETPKENGSYRTLGEIAEGNGYSVAGMGRILKDAGVTITRGKRANALTGREFRGKARGRAQRVLDTVPKLRDRRMKMGLSQNVIAFILGVNKAWASNLENAMLRATPNRIAGYALALEASDPRKSKAARAAAKQAARDWKDIDAKDKKPRKPKAGSWAEFVASLDTGERSALRVALLRREDIEKREQYA